MAQLIDFQKVRRRMWRKRLHNLLFLAGFAAIVFGVSFLVYHNGNMDLRTAVNPEADTLLYCRAAGF